MKLIAHKRGGYFINRAVNRNSFLSQENQQQEIQKEQLNRSKLATSDQVKLTQKGVPDRRGAPGVRQSKEHIEKIRESMMGKNRGKRDVEMRQTMSVSAQLRWSDPQQRQQLSMQLRNKPKTCSFCGFVGGHNRRTCPAVPVVEQAQLLKMQRLEATLSSLLQVLPNQIQAQLCPYCGELGHELKLCPELLQSEDLGCPICLSKDHKGYECKAINQIVSMPEEVKQWASKNQQLKFVVEQLKISRTKESSSTDQSQLRAWKYLSDSQRRDPFHFGIISADVTCPPIMDSDQVIQLAAAAAYRAFLSGISRQRIDLPLDTFASWPGGIQQQFMEVRPQVEEVLKMLRQQTQSGRIGVEIWEKGDAVGAWESDKLFAVLFPTANELPRIREKVESVDNSRFSIIFNPQWQLGGQIISDFGFGENKKQSEKLVQTFEQVFYHEVTGISGDKFLIVRAYPLSWHVYLLYPSPQLVLTSEQKPTYSQLEQVLRELDINQSSGSWADILYRMGNMKPLGNETDNFQDPQEEENDFGFMVDEEEIENDMGMLDIVTGENIID
eukprot:TRINITY_DN2539_c0_g1_i6.p1 TRINITY_DN2539_c0_g1~~TRINITY_DN2539_c0_g1_i6.p1  ORF type:complete len:615 (-),score=60.35 TRINITY_DN2539_c0_g1_i6:308-1972(-)